MNETGQWGRLRKAIIRIYVRPNSTPTPTLVAANPGHVAQVDEAMKTWIVRKSVVKNVLTEAMQQKVTELTKVSEPKDGGGRSVTLTVRWEELEGGGE